MGVISRPQFGRGLETALNETGREWSRVWDYSIATNFNVGGRPKWKKTRRGGNPLRDTARLSNSIIVKSRQAGRGVVEIVASTNVPYARIHQFGGTIRPTNAKMLAIPLTKEAKEKSPRNFGRDLFVLKSTEEGKATLCESIKVGKKQKVKVIAHYILLKSVKIEARPFIVVQTQDNRVLKELFGVKLRASV